MRRTKESKEVNTRCQDMNRAAHDSPPDTASDKYRAKVNQASVDKSTSMKRPKKSGPNTAK
eukprot:3174417-Heterocapsa_arctica.AAC.1